MVVPDQGCGPGSLLIGELLMPWAVSVWGRPSRVGGVETVRVLDD